LSGASTGTDERISVIVPCWNDGDFLLGAVGSLCGEPGLEILVVDDGSTDAGTLQALKTLEEAELIRVVRLGENRGVSVARDRALRESSAPYVFPLDSDDLAIPGALAAMRAKLEATPHAGVCFGDYVEFGRRELVRSVPAELDPYRLAYANEFPISALYERGLLERVGGWRRIEGVLDVHQDWDLWLTLAETGVKGVHLGPGRLTYARRTHDNRLGERGRAEHMQVYKGLKRDHPEIFKNIAEHRRHSTLPRPKRLLYPYVYGGRKRFPIERIAKTALDRAGLWTLTGEMSEEEQARLDAAREAARTGAETLRAMADAKQGR
jgi:glycosyltransferase involved in cell wall biosynthesis